MKNFELLASQELPENFKYPHQFLRAVGLGLHDLEPWFLLQGELLRSTYDGLNERYASSKLVPFARRQDNDDIACWQSSDPEKIFIVHDHAAIGWEQRESYQSFYKWLRKALEDFIEFDT